MTVQQAFKNTLVVLATIVGAYLILISARILVVLLVAIIIASAVRPAIMWMTRRRIPEGVAIILVYLVMLLTLIGLAVLVVPPIATQLSGYLRSEVGLANRIYNAETWLLNEVERFTGTNVTPIPREQIEEGVETFILRIEEAGPHVLGELGTLAGEAILVFVMGAFWLTSHTNAINFVTELFPLKDRQTVKDVIEEIEGSMGAYVRGVVGVAAFVGIANTIILSVAQVRDAITLGFIVGVTTMLPLVGGFIGGGLATILAGLYQPIQGLITFVTFVAVQQIENHYLTPRVMANSIGVNPLLVIVAVFVGFSIGGVIGAIIAVPILGTINTLLHHLVFQPRREEVKPYIEEKGVILLNTGEEVKVNVEVNPNGAATTTIQTPPATTNEEPRPTILRP
jgi:predicted PurR-regulated permease PerM